MTLAPALPADMGFIRRSVRAWKLDDERLASEQFLVAREGARAVGFGRIKPYAGCWELGAVGVLPSRRGRGIGEKVVRALIAAFPAREVWITTDLPEYFKRFGFREMSAGPRLLQEKIADLCRRKCRQARIMLLVKAGS